MMLVPIPHRLIFLTGGFMNYADVPIWEKYTLTIEEAAKYFRIGEKKLRQLADEHPNGSSLKK